MDIRKGTDSKIHRLTPILTPIFYFSSADPYFDMCDRILSDDFTVSSKVMCNTNGSVRFVARLKTCLDLY